MKLLERIRASRKRMLEKSREDVHIFCTKELASGCIHESCLEVSKLFAKVRYSIRR
jgi:hypothetical protein